MWQKQEDNVYIYTHLYLHICIFIFTYLIWSDYFGGVFRSQWGGLLGQYPKKSLHSNSEGVLFYQAVSFSGTRPMVCQQIAIFVLFHMNTSFISGYIYYFIWDTNAHNSENSKLINIHRLNSV